MSESAIWPQLAYSDWEPTKQTIHRYAQIVGKIRMALVPFRNHWWHVTLYVSARGLTTGPMPCGDVTVEIELDLISHQLHARTSRGQTVGFDLRERPACADFYAQVFSTLDELGIRAPIQPRPFDLGDGPPFHSDTLHDSYDPDAVSNWWTILRLIEQVLARFGSSFVGKAPDAPVLAYLRPRPRPLLGAARAANRGGGPRDRRGVLARGHRYGMVAGG